MRLLMIAGLLAAFSPDGVVHRLTAGEVTTL